jgi:hypothetical protein
MTKPSFDSAARNPIARQSPDGAAEMLVEALPGRDPCSVGRSSARWHKVAQIARRLPSRAFAFQQL